MLPDNNQNVIVHNSYGTPHVMLCTVANARALLDSFLENLDPAVRQVAEYRALADKPVHLVNTRLVTAALEELVAEPVGTPTKHLRNLMHGLPPRTPTLPKEVPTPGQATSPPPYSLKALQTDTKGLFGLTAKRTLELAQALYEKKAVSYPRTDCEHLAVSQKADVDATLKALARYFEPEVRTLRKTGVELRDHVFDDNKLTAHSAIVPVAAKQADLSDDEMQVFTLVAQRYLQALSNGLQFASMFPPAKPADERPEELLTQALRDEVVLWAFKHKLDANKLGRGLGWELHKYAPESLSILAGVVARANGKPLQFVEPEALDAAEELHQLLHGSWKADAKEERIVSRFLDFIRSNLASSDSKFDVAKLEASYAS